MKGTTSTWKAKDRRSYLICANGITLKDHNGQILCYHKKIEALLVAKSMRLADKRWGTDRKIKVRRCMII